MFLRISEIPKTKGWRLFKFSFSQRILNDPNRYHNEVHSDRLSVNKMNFLAFLCILLGVLLVRPERLHGFHSIKWENSLGEIFYFNNYEHSIYKFHHQIETKIVAISGADFTTVHPLNEIQDITGDNDGNLYISHCHQNLIQKLSPSPPFTGKLQENMNYYNVELVAGTPDDKLGQTEDGKTAKGNPISCPWGLAISNFNNRKQLYFVEHG
jgi:hypothetical protein